MLLKCFSCGVEKDTNIKEAYLWPEDGICDGEVEPLFVMECQPDNEEDKIWRVAVYCHSCHHKVQPDMWMSESEWDSLNPVIPFNKLPEIKSNKESYTDFNPENYSLFSPE